MEHANSLKSLHRHMATAKKTRGDEQETLVSKGDGFSVDPSLLVEQDGDNPRTAFCADYYELPDVVARIRGFADSYKKGEYVPPIIVQVVDGEIRVREGFRRRRGLLLAIAEGAPIKRVAVNEVRGDEAQQALIPVITNDGEELTPLGRAVQYQKLHTWGWTDAEIGAAVKRTAEHVRTTRALMDLPLELKYMIQAKLVSASYAAELVAQHGAATAISMVKAAQQELEKQGDPAQGAAKKVTGKHVAKATGKAPARLSKPIVEAMRLGVASITSKLANLKLADSGDAFTLTLNREEVEALQALKDKLAPFETTPTAEEAADDGQTQLPI